MTSLVRFRCAGKLLALHVDNAQVVGLHKALADHRGRADDFFLADAIGDVAVVGGGETPLVEAVADFADFLLDFVDVEHDWVVACRVGQASSASAGPPLRSVIRYHGGPALARDLVPPYGFKSSGISTLNASRIAAL